MLGHNPIAFFLFNLKEEGARNTLREILRANSTEKKTNLITFASQVSSLNTFNEHLATSMD